MSYIRSMYNLCPEVLASLTLYKYHVFSFSNILTYFPSFYHVLGVFILPTSRYSQFEVFSKISFRQIKAQFLEKFPICKIGHNVNAFQVNGNNSRALPNNYDGEFLGK